VAFSLPGLRIELRSNLGALSVSGERKAGEEPSRALGLVQPEVIVYSAGVEVARYAPAGSPSELAARVVPVLLVAVAAGLVALAVYGAVQLAR
jgi:hypothetical protein